MNAASPLKFLPFDVDLNRAVLEMAKHFTPDFVVADDAPATYAALKAHLDSKLPLIVAREGSERTIFGDASVNYAFRAWHDWCHWAGGFDFSLDGEAATCSLQIEHLRTFYGVNRQTSRWAEILVTEVIGQRRYFEHHRTYINNQRAFARAYLVEPEAALACCW